MNKTTKTFIPKEKDFQRKTYLVDASGKTLGRLASKVATVLIGKRKVVFAPDQISGDQVIIINAKDIHVTGKKTTDKVYAHYTGYPGGHKSYTFEELNAKKPDEVVRRAISRMLPKNKLGREMLRRLRIFGGAEHKHQAQKPIALEV